jgi:hypothetical protein
METMSPRSHRFISNHPEEGWAITSNQNRPIRYKDGSWNADISMYEMSNITGIWMNANDDVWACKHYDVQLIDETGQMFYRGRIYHFDGYSWSNAVLPPVSLPIPGGYKEVFGDISFFNPSNGIVVGYVENSSPTTNGRIPLAYVFRNGSWAKLAVIMPENVVDMEMNGIRMISENEAWVLARIKNNLQQDGHGALIHVYVNESPNGPVLVAEKIENSEK